MTVRLGVALTDRPAVDPRGEGGGDIPLGLFLREARAAGYAGVEAGAGFPGDAGTLRPLLEDHGLALASGLFRGGLLELGNVEDEKRRVRPHLDLLLALGCRVLAYAEATGSVADRPSVPAADRPRLRRDDLRRYGERLTKLADWLQAEGCPIAFRNQAGTVVESEAEIDLLAESTDVSVGLALDAGQLAFAGGDASGTLRRHGGRVVHVRAGDVRPELLDRARERRWSLPDALAEGVFAPPGDPDGGLDLGGACKALKEVGYAGWVVVEIPRRGRGKADPFEAAQAARAALDAACREAGLALA